MIDIVTKENRHLFGSQLDLMFQQRYQIFIKGLGWDVKHKNNREVDEYDTDDAVYFLACKESNRLGGSVRIISTTKPHLMSDCFSDLCECGPPRGPHIWEASRAYSKPNGKEPLVFNKTMGELFCSMLEYGLLFEIEKYTLVASLSIMPTILHAGWDVCPLGTSKVVNGDRIGAFYINVNVEGLYKLRRIKEIKSPVSNYVRPVDIIQTKTQAA